METSKVAQRLCAYPYGLRGAKSPMKATPSVYVGGPTVRGSRYSSYLGREFTPGLLAPLSSVRKNPGFAPRQSKPEPRKGHVCPGCGIEAPLSGKCTDCWDA